MSDISLKSLIAPVYFPVHKDIKKNKHTYYWIKGGRGSAKSSFVSIEIILGIMEDPDAFAVCLRKVGDTIADSVYSQLQWAIEVLGVEQYWESRIAPLKLIYKPTRQEILFRSASNKDDYRKVKSIKTKKGYCKYIWFEELDEFFGMEEIRNLCQSLMRGGDVFKVFFTYNPPKSVNSWVNAEQYLQPDDTLVIHTTYLDVPKEWLGKTFIDLAEALKINKPEAYRHEYMGEVTGTGGAVFKNIVVEEIPSSQIKLFDHISDGVDFGYAVDPSVYTQNHYDKKRNCLYIFNEIFKTGLTNKQLSEEIKRKKIGSASIVCDSAEPKSIAELKGYGLRVEKAKKGADSIDFGIKWLQSLDKIVIDPKRCPNTVREFVNYEYAQDRLGNFRADYVDKNNHTIDATRYSRERDMKKRSVIIGYGRI
jgi:PBSX family phage terminase large subunit